MSPGLGVATPYPVSLQDGGESVGVVLRREGREVKGRPMEAWLLQPQTQSLVKPERQDVHFQSKMEVNLFHQNLH